MTIGSHTWSHKDLAKNPYASDIEQAKQEIEMGVSAVHHAVDGRSRRSSASPTCSSRRSCCLSRYAQHRDLLDRYQFLRLQDASPRTGNRSVMSKLKKRGKGIVLMHDFQPATAEAMPEMLRQLKANGFKVVHMVPKEAGDDARQYDDMLRQQDKMDVTDTRPENSVVKTISGD